MNPSTPVITPEMRARAEAILARKAKAEAKAEATTVPPDDLPDHLVKDIARWVDDYVHGYTRDYFDYLRHVLDDIECAYAAFSDADDLDDMKAADRDVERALAEAIALVEGVQDAEVPVNDTSKQKRLDAYETSGTSPPSAIDSNQATDPASDTGHNPKTVHLFGRRRSLLIAHPEVTFTEADAERGRAAIQSTLYADGKPKFRENLNPAERRLLAAWLAEMAADGENSDFGYLRILYDTLGYGDHGDDQMARECLHDVVFDRTVAGEPLPDFAALEDYPEFSVDEGEEVTP